MDASMFNIFQFSSVEEIDKIIGENPSFSIENIDDSIIVYPTNDIYNNLGPFKISKLGASCLLSCLRMVSTLDKCDTFIKNLEIYMELYEMNKEYIKLAIVSMKFILDRKVHENQNRYIIIALCSFNELIKRIENREFPLEVSNILVNHIVNTENVEKINWKFLRPGIFGIFSSKVIVERKAPLLTFNKDGNIVVYVGKSKGSSLPVILYDPILNDEITVEISELNDIGEINPTDTLNYKVDECIIVCMDISKSMCKDSDFIEDIKAKKEYEIKAKQQFYEIFNIPYLNTPRSEDIRELKNAIIWMITHPNFNNWKRTPNRYNCIKSIICVEKEENKEINPEIMVRYTKLFVELLKNHKIKIGDETFYHKIQEIEEDEIVSSISEYNCPIGMCIMRDPVVAEDGFTYERKYITKWLKDNSLSPMTGKKIGKNIIENKTLKNLIVEFIENNKELVFTKDERLTKQVIFETENFCMKYDEDTNLFDLMYFIYQKFGKNHGEYIIQQSILCGGNSAKIKDIIFDIKIQPKQVEVIEYFISTKGVEQKFYIPSYYKIQNIIYNCANKKYHRYNIWYNLKKNGDNFDTGYCASYGNFSSENKKLQISKSRALTKNKTPIFSRMEIVKKLFDSFINRSIAYAFNNSIGLLTFNNEIKLECEITPFYETFREKMSKINEDGNTRLYDAIDESIKLLKNWKKKIPKEKLSEDLKMRIICLSDGADSSSTCNYYELESKLTKLGIKLDAIIIGNDLDTKLLRLVHDSYGYAFNPKSIKHALDIMELETIISSVNRKLNYSYGLMEGGKIPKMKKFQSSEVDIKEISLELLDVVKNPHPDIDVYVNNNITFWKLVISGPQGTVYEGGCWLVHIIFDENYPNVPPMVRFITEIKHCNINRYGRVCHSILDRNYTRSTKISLIFQCIYGLLLNPDVSDPLDTNLATLYYQADGQYEAEIIKDVKRYASKSREAWKLELS